MSFFSLATEAEKDGVAVFKFPRWRVKGQAIPEVVAQYKAMGAELNVLPFCSQFIPMEVIDHPKHGSIIYHPSLLPRHRGASAINWWVTSMSSGKGGGMVKCPVFYLLSLTTQDPDPWGQKGWVHSVLG